MYKIHHDCSSLQDENSRSPFPSSASGKTEYVSVAPRDLLFSRCFVCSAIGGGSGDSMIHLTSTLEVVRGWQGCRRRRRDSFAVCECEPWGGISFIEFISLPWPSALVSVLHQYFLFGMTIHLQKVLCRYHGNSVVLNDFCDGWNTFPINYITLYNNVFKKEKIPWYFHVQTSAQDKIWYYHGVSSVRLIVLLTWNISLSLDRSWN